MCEIISYPTFYTQTELLSILKFNFRILIGQTFSPTAVWSAENRRANNERSGSSLEHELPPQCCYRIIAYFQ